MVTIGVVSAIGYALIGLPNVFALGFLAGLLEAVPLIGPTLASVPAVLVALPLGLNTVLIVIGFSVAVQVTENNVLIPRIMHKAVGVSALVGILTVLAFGTLYGLLGVFIAIPMTAVIRCSSSIVVDVGPPATEGLNSESMGGSPRTPWTLRQQLRIHSGHARVAWASIRDAADHVADAVDQQIEEAGAQVERTISAAGDFGATDRHGTRRNRRQAGGPDGKTSSRPLRGWKRSSQQRRTRRRPSTTWREPPGVSRTRYTRSITRSQEEPFRNRKRSGRTRTSTLHLEAEQA
jgi:hypothetical protein